MNTTQKSYADRESLADLREAANTALTKYPHLCLHEALAALAAERGHEDVEIKE